MATPAPPRPISVIVSVPDIRMTPPQMPDSIDEVVLVSGYGSFPRNTGAAAASGDIFVFTDSNATFHESNLYWIRYSNHSEHWWCPRSYRTSSVDPVTESTCFAATLCSTQKLPSASIAPFQAVSRAAFVNVGGYRPSMNGYDYDLSRRLHEYGYQLIRSNVNVIITSAMRPDYTEECETEPITDEELEALDTRRFDFLGRSTDPKSDPSGDL